MRGLFTAAAIAAAAAISSPATALADDGGRQRHNDYYYGSYDTAFVPICVVRTVRVAKDDGTIIVKKRRVCR